MTITKSDYNIGQSLSYTDWLPVGEILRRFPEKSPEYIQKLLQGLVIAGLIDVLVPEKNTISSLLEKTIEDLLLEEFEIESVRLTAAGEEFFHRKKNKTRKAPETVKKLG